MEATVTIINNSGKIISNGRHLLDLFKEAKASYQEKKAAVKAERAIKRSNTFDVAAPAPQYYEEPEYMPSNPRRISYDDAGSHASSRRSHRSRHSRSSRHRSQSQTRPALTASNLQTLSEISATAPSRAPRAYRSPYAETAPWETALSRPNIARAPTMPMLTAPTAQPSHYELPPGSQYESTVVATPRQSMHVHRARSDPSLRNKPKVKEIDMDLAYGNIPPDLADRVDLDPAYRAAQKEQRARSLTKHIEGLLSEANVVHHTASHMIKHLQEKPEAAAAVALTLAELSAIVGKLGPSFLGGIQAGSPAVFALLASPQFLIAAGVTVGVTVVMFGGWKIVKRIKEAKQLEKAIAVANAEAAASNAAAAAAGAMPYPYPHQPGYAHYPPGAGVPPGAARPPYPPSGASYDEALVLEEELSTIETWRRGIESFGEAESADVELISPEAHRSQYGGDDARSTRTGRSKGTTRTHRTSRTHRTHRSSHSHRDGDEEHRDRERRRSDEVDHRDVPERTSSKAHSHTHSVHEVDGESLADSDRSRRSHRSSKSKRTVKAIEDGSADRRRAEEFDIVVRGGQKSDNMLKSLFKRKKDKEKDDKATKAESSLVMA